MYINKIQSKPKKFKSKLLSFERESGEHVSCRENFDKYLLNSTLHGLKYVGDSQLSLFERYFIHF